MTLRSPSTGEIKLFYHNQLVHGVIDSKEETRHGYMVSYTERIFNPTTKEKYPSFYLTYEEFKNLQGIKGFCYECSLKDPLIQGMIWPGICDICKK